MDSTIRVYKAEDGTLLHTLEGPSAEIEVNRLDGGVYVTLFSIGSLFLIVQWFRWHPKGPVIVAGSNDATVWMWNAARLALAAPHGL